MPTLLARYVLEAPAAEAGEALAKELVPTPKVSTDYCVVPWATYDSAGALPTDVSGRLEADLARRLCPARASLSDDGRISVPITGESEIQADESLSLAGARFTSLRSTKCSYLLRQGALGRFSSLSRSVQRNTPAPVATGHGGFGTPPPVRPPSLSNPQRNLLALSPGDFDLKIQQPVVLRLQSRCQFAPDCILVAEATVTRSPGGNWKVSW